MKKNIVAILIISLSFLQADWGDIASGFENVGEQFKAIGLGMAASFGMDPSGYSMSIRVFNNSEQVIDVCLKRVKKYQGAAFHQGIIREANDIKPGHDTSNLLNNIGLFLEIDFRAGLHDAGCIHLEDIVNMEPQYHHCSDTFYYNYFSRVSDSKDSYDIDVESLGINKTTCGDFAGQIFNTLSEPCYLTYTYNKTTFTVLLEPQSFNFLASDILTPNSMRPGTLLFTFQDGSTFSIDLPAQGLATLSSVKDAAPSPMQYHYEVIQLKESGKKHVCCTGLSVGNYTQPNVNRIRLISPVTCQIWNKSADQADSSSGDCIIQSANRTVWVGYGTPGWANRSNNDINMMVAQIPYADAGKFQIIRPTIDSYTVSLSESAGISSVLSTLKVQPRDAGKIEDTIKASMINLHTLEKEQDTFGSIFNPINMYNYIKKIIPSTSCAHLYVMSLDTADADKAKRFMHKMITGELKYDYSTQDEIMNQLSEDVQRMKDDSLTPFTIQELATGELKTDYGVIYDTETGVSGHLLISDTFLPYGNGAGPYYYTVEPPSQSIDLFKFNWLTQALLPNNKYINIPANSGSSKILNNGFTMVLANWIREIYGASSIEAGLRQVYTDVIQFLKENGVPQLFTSTGTLTYPGNKVVNGLLVGPTSIIHQPLNWFQSLSYFVISGVSAPKKWDKKLKKSVLAWFPDNTVSLTSGSKDSSKISAEKLELGKLPYPYVTQDLTGLSKQIWQGNLQEEKKIASMDLAIKKMALKDAAAQVNNSPFKTHNICELYPYQAVRLPLQGSLYFKKGRDEQIPVSIYTNNANNGLEVYQIHTPGSKDFIAAIANKHLVEKQNVMLAYKVRDIYRHYRHSGDYTSYSYKFNYIDSFVGEQVSKNNFNNNLTIAASTIPKVLINTVAVPVTYTDVTGQKVISHATKCYKIILEKGIMTYIPESASIDSISSYVQFYYGKKVATQNNDDIIHSQLGIFVPDELAEDDTMFIQAEEITSTEIGLTLDNGKILLLITIVPSGTLSMASESESTSSSTTATTPVN